MEPIKVVCGLIIKNERIFICRRASNKSMAGYWEFPGGKIEKGEAPNATLIRELNEELNMTVIIKNDFITSHHSYDSFRIELSSFLCEFVSSDFSMTDHDRYEWVLPSELLKWKLAPADIPIAKKYIEIYTSNSL